MKPNNNGPAWLTVVNGEWKEDSAKADVVRYIFDLAIRGLTPKQIADREPAPAPIGRRENSADVWTERTVDALLKSYAPIGYLDDNNDDGTMELVYPVIVDEDVWRRVQEMRGLRASGFKRSGIVFSGLMFCGYCSKVLRYRGGKSIPHSYVECAGHLRYDYETLELLVIEHMGGGNTALCVPKDGLDPKDKKGDSRSKQLRQGISVMMRKKLERIEVSKDTVTLTWMDGRVTEFETPEALVEAAIAAVGGET